MLFDEAVDLFLSHCRFEKNLSVKTLKAYAGDLAQFRLFLGRGRKGCAALAEVGREEVRGFLQGLYGRYKPRSIKRKMATLKAMFTHLEFEDHIEASPFRKLRVQVDKDRKLPRTMTLATVRRIFAAAKGHLAAQQPGGRAQREALRDVGVLEMLFATGMRVFEVCGLRDEQVDLVGGTVLVTGKGRKERLVPLCSRATLAALTAYRREFADEIERSGPFFLNRRGRGLSDQSVRRMVKRYAELAMVEQHVTPHMFRHTVATLLLENGVDIRNIQYLLGHSSISVTEIYVQVNEKAQREVLRKKHPRRWIEDN